MANTLTGLIPTIYDALDVVSREMIGFIPAVTRDTKDERAALNQVIMVPITQAQTAADNTPSQMSPDTGDQTIANVQMTISKSKHVPIRWNGEDQRGMTSTGMYTPVLQQQFQQAFRTLSNLIETDLFVAAYTNSSRAYGTAGTAPFGTAADLSDAAQLRRILDDNGTPQSDLQLVMGSAAVANLRGKQTILLKVNEAGDNRLLRQGSITALPLDGFWLHNSNAIQPLVKGTGTSYVVNNVTAAPIGATSVPLDIGSGTVVAGDVVTFATDSVNSYVVNTGVGAPGTIVLGGPGLKVAMVDETAMTIGNGYTPNMGFSRSAIMLITRAPAMPMINGRPSDLAEDSMLVTDPFSGITFEVVLYKQFRQMVFHVAVAWGTAAIKSKHIATLMG